MNNLNTFDASSSSTHKQQSMPINANKNVNPYLNNDREALNLNNDCNYYRIPTNEPLNA